MPLQSADTLIQGGASIALSKAEQSAGRQAASGETEFRPVRTRRSFEGVCDQIRRQVADGTLQPGHRLPGDRELAEQFKITRSAVREALRSLEGAGVVEARTGLHGGVFIKTGTSEGIAQAVRDMVGLGQVPTASVMEARIELTSVAIRLACERASAAELDAIEADIDYHEELFRIKGGSRNTRKLGEFYRLLARATHNEVILMLVDSLSEIVRTLLARIDPKPRADMIQVRRTVLRHMRARDARRAVAAMAAHQRQLAAYLEELDREMAGLQPEPAAPATRTRQRKSVS
jgi:GntR family transcriptional regulator, transcriptional repressor for pyruvate dehydrogenase complex